MHAQNVSGTVSSTLFYARTMVLDKAGGWRVCCVEGEMGEGMQEGEWNVRPLAENTGSRKRQEAAGHDDTHTVCSS